MADTLAVIGRWLDLIRDRPDLVLVERASQVVDAKQAGKTGVVFHLQGAEAVGDNLNLIDVVKRLGVGIIQLTYNVENRLGYGCQTEDKGLKPFGRAFIDRCNQAKVIVDCSHTGYRTTMDTIEHSDRPVIFSHANPMALWHSRVRAMSKTTDSSHSRVGWFNRCDWLSRLYQWSEAAFPAAFYRTH